MTIDGDIPEELKAAIRKEAFQQVSKWVIGAFLGALALAVLGWWALLKPLLVSELGIPPRGAIISFDSREKCPESWVEYSAADGKMLVGMSANLEFGSSGGKSTIVLTADQLPPHVHPIDAVLTWPGRAWIRPSDETDNNPSSLDRSLKGTRKTGVQGGPAQPIDIMPPYLVIRYCVKS
jgi:hypothetical protein